jgi:transcription elongation GreA/GreB family factor
MDPRPRRSHALGMTHDPSLSAPGGGARPGALVHVQGRGGERFVYELGYRAPSHPRATQVSLESPVGEALLGAQAGDVVSVTLPGGLERVLCVVAVYPAEPADTWGRRRAAA